MTAISRVPVRNAPHGTAGGYTNHGCRCRRCLNAASDLMRRCKEARVKGEGRRPTPHGTYNGYTNYGCRCDRCRAANTARARALRTGELAGHD